MNPVALINNFTARELHIAHQTPTILKKGPLEAIVSSRMPNLKSVQEKRYPSQ